MTRRVHAVGGALALVVVMIALFALRNGSAPLVEPQKRLYTAGAVASQGLSSSRNAAETAPGAARSESRMEVRVLDPRRHSVTDCAVIVWVAGSSESLERTTGADGLATFPSTSGDGGLAVFSPHGLRAYRSPISLDRNQEIVLDGSASVAGVVLVVGQPAPLGVELTLKTAWTPPPPDAPESIRKLEADRSAMVRTTTRRSGAFEFDGLPPDWRGTLLPPPTHWIVDAPDKSKPQSLDLPAPDPRVTLGLTHLPTVHGRVVWKDTGLPIANAPVMAVGGCSDGVSASRSGTTDANGQFQLGLTPTRGGQEQAWLDAKTRPALVDVQITCAGVPGSEGALDQRLSWAEAQSSVTLELVRAKLVRFTAETQGGVAVVDAVVDSGECTPTDALGRGGYRGPTPKWIGAPGFSVAPALPLSGDGSASSPFRFVLSPGNSIRFRIRGIRQAHAEFCRVCVVSKSPLVAGGSKWRSPFHRRFGAGSWGGGTEWIASSDGEQQQWIVLDCSLTATLECVLDSLQPGVTCKASVLDSLGIVLAETALVTPPFGQDVEIELSAQEEIREVEGMVTGLGGEPVPNAVVRLKLEKASTFCLTRPDGQFQLVSAARGGALLHIEKSGHIKAEIPLDLERLTPLHIRLAKGRTVTVRVIDADGVPVDLYPAPVGFESTQQQVVGEGIASWPDLPESVEFQLSLQGRVFKATCNLPCDAVDIVVPRLGALRVIHSDIARDNGLDEANCYVELVSMASPQTAPVRVKYGPGEVIMKHLIPGDYRASLVLEQKGKGGAAGTVLPTGLSTTVRVEAGTPNAIRF